MHGRSNTFITFGMLWRTKRFFLNLDVHARSNMVRQLHRVSTPVVYTIYLPVGTCPDSASDGSRGSRVGGSRVAESPDTLPPSAYVFFHLP